jgi:tRNA modification GTPase
VAETITALATAPGIGGIAVVRISGDDAFEVVDKSFQGKIRISDADANTIHYGKFYNGNAIVDTVTVSVFRNPRSYTGEDVAEISCHGGNIVSDKIIKVLLRSGARLATSGEFTQRAYINGKLDLAQVEAVADLIHAQAEQGAQTAARQLNGEFTKRLEEFRLQLIDVSCLLELEMDFADEDIEFLERQKIVQKIDDASEYCRELADSYSAAEILRSGFFVGIAGYPNSGKSTLFNSLLNRKRAIVSEIPGTTRDYLEESIMINGISVRLIDTAGLRETDNTIEIEGIRMVKSILEQSNMILVINDASISIDNSESLYEKLKKDYPSAEVVLLQNKTDLIDEMPGDAFLSISAKYDNGIEKLKKIIYDNARGSTERIKDVLINQRHATLLERAALELDNAKKALSQGMENELVSIDIRSAVKILGEIAGSNFSEDVLNSIFSRFCIGK